MSRISLTPLVTVALLIAGLAGCSSSSESRDGVSQPESTSRAPATSQPGEAEASEEPAEAEPVVITIEDFKFEGPRTVAPGATVMVVNNDRSSHTVTSETDEFEEVIVEGGAAGTFIAPDQPGEYSYVCDFHPEMTGTLVVK